MYGQNIRRYREQSGLSQEDLVAKLRALGHKITLARYRRIEEDKSMLYLYDVAMLSKVLGVCPGVLLGDCPSVLFSDAP